MAFMHYVRRYLEPALYVIVPAAAVIGGWALLVKAGHMQSDILPTPAAVAHSFGTNWSLLASSSEITFYEALIGFVSAIAIGVPLAAIVVYSRRFGQRILLPYLVAFNAIPKVAVAPIIVIWLGLGLTSKMGMSFLLCFFPIVVNTASGLSRVDPDLLAYFRLMRASKTATFFRARLPNALPAFFDGLKIALPIAIIGAIVGEFVASQEGIGYELIIAYSHFDTALVFAGVLIVAVASTVLFQLLVVCEHLVIRWDRSNDR